MNGPGIILIRNKSDRGKNKYMILLYVKSKNDDTCKLILQNRNRLMVFRE